jgi:hypothetical protein
MNDQIDKDEVNAIIQTLQMQRNQALDQLAQASALINKLQRELEAFKKN